MVLIFAPIHVAVLGRQRKQKSFYKKQSSIKPKKKKIPSAFLLLSKDCYKPGEIIKGILRIQPPFKEITLTLKGFLEYEKNLSIINKGGKNKIGLEAEGDAEKLVFYAHEFEFTDKDASFIEEKSEIKFLVFTFQIWLQPNLPPSFFISETPLLSRTKYTISAKTDLEMKLSTSFKIIPVLHENIISKEFICAMATSKFLKNLCFSKKKGENQLQIKLSGNKFKINEKIQGEAFFPNDCFCFSKFSLKLFRFVNFNFGKQKLGDKLILQKTIKIPSDLRTVNFELKPKIDIPTIKHEEITVTYVLVGKIESPNLGWREIEVIKDEPKEIFFEIAEEKTTKKEFQQIEEENFMLLETKFEMGVKIFKCQKSSSKSTRLPLSDQIPSPHPITSLEPTNLPSYRKNGKNEKNIAHRKRESSRSVDFSRTLTPKIEILNGNILFDEILGEKSHVTKEEYIHEIAP